MKLLKKSILLIVVLFTVASCEVSIEDPINSSNNFTRTIDLRVNGADNAIAGLFQYVENGLWYIATESRTGLALQDAYFVLQDGTKQMISNIKEFALTNNIIAIEVNFVPGTALQGFTLNANNYQGYYLGNTYTMQLKPTIIPIDATNKVIKYFSSNSSIISVNNEGKLFVKGVGNVVISALSLEGNFKQTVQMSIQDGKAVLKDSVVNADLSQLTIAGNRFDENSGQSSTFRGVTFNQTQTEIITVGSAKINNNQNIALVSKFGIKEENTNSSLNIDSSNEYFSEELNDVVFDQESQNYFAVGSVKLNSNSKNRGLLVKFSENQSFSPSRLQLNKVTTYNYTQSDFPDSDAFFTGVQASDEYVLVSGYLSRYDILNPFSTSRATFLMFFDLDLNLMSTLWFNNYINGAIELSSLNINPFNSNIIVTGNTNNATFISEISFLNSELVVKSGYYSNIANAKIIEVATLSEDEYVAIGNGVINNKDVSFVTTFSLVNGEFQAYNSRKNEFYDGTYANKVIASNGMITVIGYAKENELLNLNRKEYATLTNYDYSLRYLNGKVFFNGNVELFSNKGRKQKFLDAVITEFNTLIGVGESNYNLVNQYNGYIQYNISPI
jgi:hypothetical protein